jgi:hypothetical protein
MKPFAYPQAPHARRHGPQGFKDYENYRPWLRDEFSFLCVYCLTRERWGKGKYGFQVDHLKPQSKSSAGLLAYDNLVYACATCNQIKADIEDIPDPCNTAYGQCLQIQDDGTIIPLNNQGRLLIKILRLDNYENTEFRRLILDILKLAESEKSPLYTCLLRFPDDLPDLARKKPPRNIRPQGIAESFLARRKRNELPEIY